MAGETCQVHRRSAPASEAKLTQDKKGWFYHQAEMHDRSQAEIPLLVDEQLGDYTAQYIAVSNIPIGISL